MIEKIRKEIDDVDKRIVELLSQRQNLVKEIAKTKKEFGLPITQKEREEEIIKKAKEKNKLNPSFVENLFNLIIKESKKIQK